MSDIRVSHIGAILSHFWSKRRQTNMKEDKAQLLLGVFGEGVQRTVQQFEILHITLAAHGPEGHKREHALGKTGIEADLS